MTTQFVERMAVEIDGDGDGDVGSGSGTVVCLHGLGGTSNTWTPLMPALARRRTVRIDLPGSGRSHRVEGPLSIERFVDAVLSVCERLGIERFGLVGHSLGTIVATHLAVREPGRVERMALFGPLLCPPDGARDNIRARAAKARSEGPEGMAAIADALVAASTSADTRRQRPLAVALVRESLMRQDADGYARCSEALADAQAAAIDSLTLPTLLVTGDDDVVAPPQAVRAIQERIRGSRMVVYPRCGHWAPFERAEECTRDLREFLDARH